jgi:hypothetical protein
VSPPRWARLMASFDSARPNPLRPSQASTSATVLPTRVVFAFKSDHVLVLADKWLAWVEQSEDED